MNIEILEEIDSTNDYLKRKNNNKEFDIIMAHKQTKGRGTRGRVWLSTEGVLMFSCVIKEDKNISIEEYLKLPLIAGLSLLQALEQIEELPFMFKWTNDIYLYDKKISGILIEKSGEDFIVGIGINLNIEEFGDVNGISLKVVTHKQYDKMEVLGLVVNKLKENLFRFYQGEWKLLLCEINCKNYLKNKVVTFIKNGVKYLGEGKEINENGEFTMEINGELFSFGIGEATTSK